MEETSNREFCLNPSFWVEDDGWRLVPEVREAMLNVRDDVIRSLSEELGAVGERFSYLNFTFTGSLVGANWDETSDVDLHFIVDFGGFGDPPLMRAFLSYFAKNFNENKFTMNAHSVELYFQDSGEVHRSPGVYDVEDDSWIREPDCVRVEVTEGHREKAREMFSRINGYVEQWNSGLVGDPETFLGILRGHMRSIKAYREAGLKGPDGMYSFENVVFKLLRRNGALRTLVTLMRNVKRRMFDVEQPREGRDRHA